METQQQGTGGTASDTSSEIDYAASLSKLDDLQAKLYELRLHVPNLLRLMAHLNEHEATNSIFSKGAQEVHSFNADVEAFIKQYNDLEPVLELGRTQKSKLKQEPQTNNEKQQQQQEEEQHQQQQQGQPQTNGMVNGNNTNVNTGPGTGSGSADEPIVLDESMNFVQL